MLTITDAASETMIRLDMTNPFLRLVTKLNLGARSAGSAHRCSNLRLKVQRTVHMTETSGFAVVPRLMVSTFTVL
jgi:hypothetical protein